MKNLNFAFLMMIFLINMHQKANAQLPTGNPGYKNFLVEGKHLPDAETFANDLYFGRADYLQPEIKNCYSDSLVEFINYNQQALRLVHPADKQEALTMIIEGKDTVLSLPAGDLQVYGVSSDKIMKPFYDNWAQVKCRIWRSPTTGKFIVLYRIGCANLVKDMRYPYVPDIVKKEPETDIEHRKVIVYDTTYVNVQVLNQVPSNATNVSIYNQDCGCQQQVQYVPVCNTCYSFPQSQCQSSWAHFDFSFVWNNTPYYGYYQNPVQGWSGGNTTYNTTYNTTNYTYNIITINPDGTTTTTGGATNGTDGTTTGGNTNGNDGGVVSTGGANTNGSDGYYGVRSDPSSNTNHSKFVPKSPITSASNTGSNLQISGNNSFVPKSPITGNNNVNTNVVTTTGNMGTGYTTTSNTGTSTTAGNTALAYSGPKYNVISPNGSVIATTTGGVTTYTTGTNSSGSGSGLSSSTGFNSDINHTVGSTIAYSTNASGINTGTSPVFYTGVGTMGNVHGTNTAKPVIYTNSTGFNTATTSVGSTGLQTLQTGGNAISYNNSNPTHYSNGSNGLGLATLGNTRPTTNLQQGNYGNGVATNLSSLGNSAHSFSMGSAGAGMISSVDGRVHR